MPPHLHPRSRATTSLFATTLLLSFAVVSLPHIYPCPVEPKHLAEGPAVISYIDDNGQTRYMRRKSSRSTAQDGPEDEAIIREMMKDAKRVRECPVPKPTGVIGRMLGFQDSNEKS